MAYAFLKNNIAAEFYFIQNQEFGVQPLHIQPPTGHPGTFTGTGRLMRQILNKNKTLRLGIFRVSFQLHTKENVFICQSISILRK